MRIANVTPDILRPGWLVHGLPTRIHREGGLAGVFFAKATYRMRHQAGCEPWGDPEVPCGDTPLDGDPAMGIGYPSDFVPYKPHGEYVVYGHAFPASQGVTHYPVGVRIGEVTRRLTVFGDRAWKRSLLGEVPGDPAAAEKVLLSYANAWGGLEYPFNPIGRGREGDKLPNLELATQHIASRSDRLQPAGFAPIPADWPLRKSKLGSYDDEWLKTRWPWFPNDFDWTYFNAAPPSQWLPTWLRGDEELEFVSLHPERSRYQTKLPAVRARCFITQTSENGERFRQVPMVLDTLWVSPEEEKLILVWRGHASVSHLKMKDVTALMILLEALSDRERSLEEYAQLQAETLAVPEPPLGEAPPTAEEIQAEIDAAVADGKKMEKEIRAEIDEGQKAVDKHLAEHHELQKLHAKPDVTVPDPRQAPDTAAWDPGIADRVRSKVDDPDMIAAAENIEGLFKQEHAKSLEFDKMFDSKMKEALAVFPKSMTREPPGPQDAGDPAKLDEDGFSNFTLEGYDFSGKDLSGQNFSGAQLLGCNFRDARLDGACLEQASFAGCDLTAASFEKASLGRAVFEKCEVRGTSWAGANVAGVNLSAHDLSGCDFSGVVGANAQFRGADLRNARFRGAELPFAVFSEAILEGADFTGASLVDADCATSRAVGVILADCDLTRFRAGFGANLDRADLRGSHGPQSVWQNSSFEGAHFRGGSFLRAQMSESNFTGAIFERCDLREASFEDSKLDGVNFTHANLLRVLFDRASLVRAFMTGANLYQSSFWEADLRSASWRQANVTGTVLAGKS